MFIKFIIRPRSEVGKAGENEGNPFGLQNGIPVRYLKMKMRSRGLAAVSEAADHPPTSDMIVNANFDAAGL